MQTQAFVAAATLFLLAAAPQGNAAIVLSGNFNTGNPVPALTITEDIVFNLGSDSVGGFSLIHIDMLVLRNWTSSDNSPNDVPLTGDVFLAWGGGMRVSDIVLVPEPSALAVPALLLRRRA